MTDYHVSRGGRTLGVYPEADARDYYAQGRIAANDLVWREGMPSWVEASQVFGPGPQPVRPTAPAVPPPVATEWTAPPSPSSPAGAANAGAAAALPPPPKLHWALVLLFSLLTLGVFYVVWSFMQAFWVRKFHPGSNAVTLLAVYVVLVLLGQMIAGANDKDSNEATAGGLLILAGTVVDIVASFSIRRSLLDHFNKVEPIGLRLSAALTFFFGAVYLQYHLTRIGTWQETGVPPQ